MPKPVKGARLGSGPAHQRLMLAGLAAALFRYERIRTTESKARRLRPVAEKLITLGKSGTVHARRQALAVIEDRDVIHKLFADIAPRYVDRAGGYTRMLRLGPRKGDAAMMALVELVEGEAPAAAATADDEKPKRRRGVIGRRRVQKKAADAEALEEGEVQAGESDEGKDDRPRVPEVEESTEGPEASEEVPETPSAEAGPAPDAPAE